MTLLTLARSLDAPTRLLDGDRHRSPALAWPTSAVVWECAGAIRPGRARSPSGGKKAAGRAKKK